MSTSGYCELRVCILVRRDNPIVDEALTLLSQQSEGEVIDIDYEEAEAPEPEMFYDNEGILRPAAWFDALDWLVEEEIDRREMCDLDGMVPPAAEVFDE